MAENQTFYYLKLKEGFFESDTMRLLESMENGYLYSNILLKLYLKSLKNNGSLLFNELIPYNVKMLATLTGHNPDIVEKALAIFKELALIEILDNGVIFMLDIQKYIGSISSEGERKAQYRERIKQERESLKVSGGTMLGQCPDIISISNYNSVSNSVRDNAHARAEESGQAASDVPKRKRFVKPSVEDIKAYCAEAAICIDAQRFWDFYESKGWKVGSSPMKDWKAAVRNWARRDTPGGTTKPSDNSNPSLPFETTIN